jgi:pimeloyl-ACP methyl ester carboxylesterase
MITTTAWKTIVQGSGPRTLVMIPGAMGTATIFDKLMPVLATNLRVVSAEPPAEADAVVLADQLAALLDELGAPKIDLMGTSFGGFVVQYFTAKYPERVNTLVLSNTFNDPSFSPRRRPLDELQAEAASEMHGKAIKMITGTPESPTRDMLLYQLGIQPPESFKARQVGLALRPAAPLVDLDKVKLVLIDTKDDPVVAPPARDDLVAKYSTSPRYTLEKGGHFPYVVNVEEYAKTLREAIGAPA